MENLNVIKFKPTPLYTVASFLLALIFASVLASLPVDAFVDRDNYLLYVTNSAELITRGLNEGLAHFFTNEPLWLFVNMLLSLVFSDQETVRIIIFFSAFVSSYLILKIDSRFFFILFLFLLLPQVLKNYVIHLRQGFCVSVFLLGWFARGKYSRNLLILLTPFIHASFFFVVAVYYCNISLRFLKFSSGLRVMSFALVGGAASLLTLALASSLGARQAGVYGENNLEISGLGFVFWSAVAFVYFSQGKEFIKENGFQIGMLIFYLSTYFFLPVSARIFESALILILVSGLQLTFWRLQAYLLLFLFYFVMQWYPRFFQPGLGWGIENYM